MNCPSCGWEQEEGLECVACGIVFAKFRARTPAAPPRHEEAIPAPAEPPPPPVAEEGEEDPWGEDRSFAAREVEAPKGDLYDPDAAAPAALGGRTAGLRVIRSMPRIGPFDTLVQSVETILRRPLWFGSLWILQWSYLWLLSHAKTVGELLAAVGLGLLVVGYIAAAAMVGFRAADRGLPLGLPDTLQALMRTPLYLVTVFLWSLLVGLVIAGPVVGSFFLLGPVAATLVSIGFVALAAIAATAIWGVAGPAAVDERIGPIRALGRSRKLTDGSRLAIVGSLVLLGLAGWLLQKIPTEGSLGFVSRLALGFHSLVGTTWWAVLYYRLRSLDEGVPMDELDSSLDPAWNAQPESGIPA